MWQKCPICEGSGKSLQSVLSNSIGGSCTTCAGTKIISTLSGLPPRIENIAQSEQLERERQKWITAILSGSPVYPGMNSPISKVEIQYY